MFDFDIEVIFWSLLLGNIKCVHLLVNCWEILSLTLLGLFDFWQFVWCTWEIFEFDNFVSIIIFALNYHAKVIYLKLRQSNYTNYWYFTHEWRHRQRTFLIQQNISHITISDLYYNTNSANIDNEHRSHGKQFYKSGYWIVHYKTNSHITSAVYFASSTRYRMNEIIYTLHTHNNCSLINIPDNKLCVLLLSWQQILLIILCILVNYQLMRQLCNNIDVFLIV